MAKLGGAKPFATEATGGGGAGSDTTAIHDNVAAEISAVTEKASPVNADLVLIEDSADSNNKKRVQVGNLPAATNFYPTTSVERPEDFSNVTETSLAPGAALSEGDATWSSTTVSTSILAADATIQPPSGVGAIKEQFGANFTGTQNLYVDFSSSKDGTGQVLAFWLYWAGTVGTNHKPDQIELVVGSSTGLGGTTVTKTLLLGPAGKWQDVRILLDDEAIQSFQSVGIQQRYGLQDRSTIATFERSTFRMADVRFKRQTEGENALLDAASNFVLIQPDYSPTGTEDSQHVLATGTRSYLDTRDTVRVLSDFNGTRYVRQYLVDGSGTVAVDEELSDVFNNIDVARERVEFGAGARYLLADDVPIRIAGHRNLLIEGNGAQLITNRRREKSMLEISQCRKVTIRDLDIFGWHQQARNGTIVATSSLTSNSASQAIDTAAPWGSVTEGHVAINLTTNEWGAIGDKVSSTTFTVNNAAGDFPTGFTIGDDVAVVSFDIYSATTPTVSTTNIILNENGEEIGTSLYLMGRDEDLAYKFLATLSDSAQVADDLYWEIRSQYNPLYNDDREEVNTQDGGDSDVTTDTTVDAWTLGTLTMDLTPLGANLAADGVLVGMRVFNDSATTTPGVITTVNATSIVLSAAPEVGTWTAGDTIHIGSRDPDDRPMPRISAVHFQRNGIQVGDIIENVTDGSWAIIGEVRDGEVRIDEKDAWKGGSTDEITDGDQFRIFRRYDSGTKTLTGTPTSYTFQAYPDEDEFEVQLRLKKNTATANTITVASYTAHNPTFRNGHGTAAAASDNFFSATYEDAHGIKIVEGCFDVTIEACHIEGGLGGDAVTSSIDNVNSVVVRKTKSLYMGRQGFSFNWTNDATIDDCYIVGPGRSGIDAEPFAPNWYIRRLHIRDTLIKNTQLYGIACANWEQIHWMRIDNVTYDAGPNKYGNGAMEGGATSGLVTNFYDINGTDMLCRGANMHWDNIHARRIQVLGSDSKFTNIHEDTDASNSTSPEFIVVGAAATRIYIDGVYVLPRALSEATAGSPTWAPISNRSSTPATIHIRNVHMGEAQWTYTTAYPSVAANSKPEDTPWHPFGQNMFSEPHLNVGQQSAGTVSGPNVGEYNNSPDAAATFNLTFPTISVPNLTLTSATPGTHADGDLAINADYAIRAVSKFGGPGGTAQTDNGNDCTGANVSVFFIIDNILQGTSLIPGIAFYRRTNGTTPYTHRAIWRQYGTEGRTPLEGMMGFRTDQGYGFYDLGTNGIRINKESIWTPVDVAWETGTLTLTPDPLVYDGADNTSNTVYEDASADFLAEGVKKGYLITNDTTSDTATITGVTKTTITHGALAPAGTNWRTGDDATITKQWSITEDETGWEPDLNYSVFTDCKWANASTPIAEKRHDGINYTWGTTPAATDLFDYEIRRLKDGS